MDLFLNILIPLLLILTFAGLVQPKLFVFWSRRKTRLQGFTGYLIALLLVMTMPVYIAEGGWLNGLIMGGIVICAPLFIAGMIAPGDVVFWSAHRTRIKAGFVYLGGLAALISLQTLTGPDATDSPFAWLFTPAVLSIVALAGAVFNPGEVWVGEKAPARAKAIAVYLPLVVVFLGGMHYLGERIPRDLSVERYDFSTDFAPGSVEGALISRLDALEQESDFTGLLRELRGLETIYEYQAALGWLKNRTFANISEPRLSLLYALTAYEFRDPDNMRALADTAAQVQVVGMTILRIDAARCVDENAAMGKVRVWTTLSEELLEDLKSRSRWEQGNLTEAALNIEDTVADRPAAGWLCSNDPSNIRNESAWQQYRTTIRQRIEDGLLFKGGKS